jgi:hypothetical protein
VENQTGLGDIVAFAFATVGITKERAQGVAKAFGVGDCGCEKRQRWLTEQGARYLGIGQTDLPTKEVY